MKVASTKYKVATSIIAIFIPKNVYMYQNVFTTTIDYFCEFYRNFKELWTIRKKLDTGNRDPNSPYWTSRAQKNDMDEVQAGSGIITYPEELICYLNVCYTVLYTAILHLQGVAPRSQYSDPAPEVVTLH